MYEHQCSITKFQTDSKLLQTQEISKMSSPASPSLWDPIIPWLEDEIFDNFILSNTGTLDPDLTKSGPSLSELSPSPTEGSSTSTAVFLSPQDSVQNQWADDHIDASSLTSVASPSPLIGSLDSTSRTSDLGVIPLGGMQHLEGFITPTTYVPSNSLPGDIYPSVLDFIRDIDVPSDSTLMHDSTCVSTGQIEQGNNPKLPFQCPIWDCGKLCKNKKSLSQHKRDAHVKPKICDICTARNGLEEGFGNTRDLLRHMEVHHLAEMKLRGIPGQKRPCPNETCGYRGRPDNVKRHFKKRHAAGRKNGERK